MSLRDHGILKCPSLHADMEPPETDLVFSSPLVATLQNVLTNPDEPAALSVPRDPPCKPRELDVGHVLLAPVPNLTSWYVFSWWYARVSSLTSSCDLVSPPTHQHLRA